MSLPQPQSPLGPAGNCRGRRSREPALPSATKRRTTGPPTKATVKPPAPFAGIAEFALESPQLASWTGNLSVAIPTLGTVALAGPRFNPLLCGAGGCTETAPEKRPQVVSGGKFEGNFFPG